MEIVELYLEESIETIVMNVKVQINTEQRMYIFCTHVNQWDSNTLDNVFEALVRRYQYGVDGTIKHAVLRKALVLLDKFGN